MKPKTLILNLFVSCILIFTSLFIPITVNNQQALLQVKHGLPVAFIIQEHNQFPDVFPYTIHFYNPQENITRILWLQFFIDLSIIFTVITFFTYLISSRKSK